MIDEDWPIASTYKGVGIHAGQSSKRVKLVQAEIRKVGKISDLIRLSTITCDSAWSPEARIYAGARALAGIRRAVERREPRPDIDAELLDAYVSGLASRGWANPWKYCSLLDVYDERAVEREVPLE